MTSWQQREQDNRIGFQFTFSSFIFAAVAAGLAAAANSSRIRAEHIAPAWLMIVGSAVCGLLFVVCFIGGVRMIRNSQY
jgi:uncharacterized integral membrane protein